MKSDEYGAVSDRVQGLAADAGGTQVSGYSGDAGPRKVNSKYIIFLFAMLLLIIAASFYLEKSVKWTEPSHKCADGTLINKCSATLPMYCMNGELVEKASLCGCPDDYAVNGSRCLRVQRCEDGTLYGRCSNKVPLFCSMGQLIPKASVCGCPKDYLMTEENCEKIKKCHDGTLYAICSENKPCIECCAERTDCSVLLSIRSAMASA